nr:MAG TPA: tail protein [Caudoviricetes sp.]
MRATERTYTLVIGRPVIIGEKPVNIEKFANTSKGDAYEIKNLHIDFSVKKDNSKEPNKGYVTVFNLSDEVVNYLSVNQRESLAVLFYAGYNGDEKLIFSGTVEYVEDNFPQETRETKFILGDGTLNLTTATTARSYRKGTPLNSVLNDLISDLKLPKGRIIDFGSQTLQASMAFTGNASQNLANLAKNTGSTFSVQDGAVYWTREGSRFNNVMFEISEEGGMVGTPTPKQPSSSKKLIKAQSKAKAGEKPKASKKKKEHDIKEDVGMTVSTRLNGAILPESTVYLNTRYHKGFYKVAELTHRGGYETGEWVTELGLVETRGELMQ